MAITIKDVARECGMSISTVSKVFNSYPDISEETRRQVLEVSRRIGYQPNAIARALKTNRSYNLGVLFVDENVSGLTHPFFAEVLNAFKTEAEAHGYDITFINHKLGANAMTYLEHCRYRNVDGVCLACVDFYAPEVLELVHSSIPNVTIDHLFENRPCVLSDNESGIAALVNYAVAQGHRRIAYVHGQRNSTVTDDRISGFRRAMRENGLPLPEHYLIEGRYLDLRVNRDRVLSLMRLPEPPTCVLLPDDESYLGAMEAARDLDKRIPEDFSVAGYDGMRLTQTMRPRLTTMTQDCDALGREAARRLIQRVERPAAAVNEPEWIQARLTPGETVARLNG